MLITSAAHYNRIYSNTYCFSNLSTFKQTHYKWQLSYLPFWSTKVRRDAFVELLPAIHFILISTGPQVMFVLKFCNDFITLVIKLPLLDINKVMNIPSAQQADKLSHLYLLIVWLSAPTWAGRRLRCTEISLAWWGQVSVLGMKAGWRWPVAAAPLLSCHIALSRCVTTHSVTLEIRASHEGPHFTRRFIITENGPIGTVFWLKSPTCH